MRQVGDILRQITSTMGTGQRLQLICRNHTLLNSKFSPHRNKFHAKVAAGLIWLGWQRILCGRHKLFRV